MPDEEAQESQTILAARIPESLRARIREAAKMEERSESAFVRFHLGRIADAALAETASEKETPQ
jgi:uncharacterized protein (DUF1778 family)